MSARDTLLGILRQWTRGYDLDNTPEQLVNAHAAEAVAAALHQAADEINQAQSRLVAKKTVVNILRRRANTAGEKTTAEATTTAPDFFQVGHTYARGHHGDTIRFLVEHVSTSPDGRYRVAHGWRTRSWEPGWEPSDSDDLTGWTDVTQTEDR